MNQRKSPFTLIELLVVIAIIAILAGILLTALKAVGDKKDEVATKKMIMDLAMGVSKYYEANGEYPAADTSTNNVQNSKPDDANYGDPTNRYNSLPLRTLIVNAGYAVLEKDYAPNDPPNNTKILDSWGRELKYYPMDAYGSGNFTYPWSNTSGGKGPKSSNGRYMNPTTFQIISLGVDGSGNNMRLGNF